VTITPWNEALNEVVFNGQSYLAVDKSVLHFYQEVGYPKNLFVTTDYPDGWTVDELPTWLEVVTPSSPYYTIPPAPTGADILVLRTKDPYATAHASDEFYIVAGNLRKRITVTRENEAEFYLVITDEYWNPITELFFEANDGGTNPPAPQVFRVTWLPVAASLDIAELPGTPPFEYDDLLYDDGIPGGVSYDDFADAGVSPLAGTSSPVWPYREAVFMVQPPAAIPNDPARASRVDFSVTSGGRTIMLPLFLRQEEGPLPTYAFSDGGATLRLFANFPWDVDNLNDSYIWELADLDIADDVTTLVVEGNSITDDGLKAIGPKGGAGNLLPNLTVLSLPDFARAIPDQCFYNAGTPTAPWLQSFSAPKATAIGEYAFYKHSGLTSVTLLAVTTIRSGAFRQCSGLSSVSLPKAIELGEQAFTHCSNLYSVDLPKAEVIGMSAFYGCPLTIISSPEAIEIGVSAFNGCTSLASVDFLPKATKIGMMAFNGCTSLTSVSLPKAIEIGMGAFGECSLLTILKLGATNISFGINVFTNVPTTTATLELNANIVSPALPSPGTLPQNNATWAGYQWGTIKEYQP
jgi:hypothetical protein